MGATFFNGNTDYILVMTARTAYLFDSRTSLLHDTVQLVSSVFVSDYNNTLFMCRDNTIYEYIIKYGILTT